MANIAASFPTGASDAASPDRPKLDGGMSPVMVTVFAGFVAAGLLYAAFSLYVDVADAPAHPTTALPFVLLGVALVVALGFEFVNGFHDTANAVATVIYTHSLAPPTAVVWSGFWNFAGVMASSGAVAYAIVSLLPVELILQVGSGAGFAMVFALLIAAMIWNIGTWSFGLPASSSHTLIGSIIGVGLANQLMAPAGSSTSGVDWSQAVTIGESLLVSPVVGFVASALLFLVLKFVVRNPALYREPKGTAPPPLWIRGLLVLTCTGVSFAHGSNDGQKGMGLIMLILIGTVPTAFALNRAMPDSQVATFEAAAHEAEAALTRYAGGISAPPEVRLAVAAYVQTHALKPETVPALARLAAGIASEVSEDGSLKRVPAEKVTNVRNDMYLSAEALRLMAKAGQPAFDAKASTDIAAYRSHVEQATRFIPTWVKVAVAISLGLGTMVGWRRIVVTVGEKIGKRHMTYGQGASAELVAMVTIGAADMFGLPVSTTHVLSSGVAGTMAANGSGLQWSTVRNLALAWVLTLPAAIALSATLYLLFRHLF